MQKKMKQKTKRFICPLRKLIIYLLQKIISFFRFILWLFATTTQYDTSYLNQYHDIRFHPKIQLDKHPLSPIYYTQLHQNYDNIQNEMVCSISQEIMIKPAILTACGHSFERTSITNWLKMSNYCPLCHTQINKEQVYSNELLQKFIHAYEKKKNQRFFKQKNRSHKNIFKKLQNYYECFSFNKFDILYF